MKLFVSIQLPMHIIYNPFNTNLHENNGDEWGTAFLSVPAQHCDTTWHLSVTIRRCAPNYFYWFICLFIPLIIQCTVKTKTSTPSSIWKLLVGHQIDWCKSSCGLCKWVPSLGVVVVGLSDLWPFCYSEV